MTGALWLLALLVLARPAVAVVRFVRLPPAGKRYWLPARWARLRWRWFCRNAGLGYLDKHHRRVLRLRLPFTTAVRVREDPVNLMRWPRARFYANEHGIEARVRTIPRVGQAEFEQAAAHIADQWRCHRVSVVQPEPGRLVVRGLRRDPLAVPLATADVPAQVYGNRFGLGPSFRVYLGRDEFGTDRWVPLANITAAVTGGMPGTGKTTLAHSLLCQLAPSRAVRLVIADGQGGADFLAWKDRAYAYAGDDRAEGADLFEDAHAEMRRRYATVLERTGHRNAWRAGPTEAFPLYFLLVDEANVFLDETMVKGNRQAETDVRRARAMVGQLVRRGRSVMMFTWLICHKPTSDSLPSFISANAGLRLAFGLQTVEGAVSVLGESIRQRPTLSPLTLQDPSMVGVLTARLTTGTSPFTRLRVPALSEEASDRRARETARMLAEPQETPVLTVV